MKKFRIHFILIGIGAALAGFIVGSFLNNALEEKEDTAAKTINAIPEAPLADTKMEDIKMEDTNNE